MNTRPNCYQIPGYAIALLWRRLKDKPCPK